MFDVFLAVGPLLSQLTIYERIEQSKDLDSDLIMSINKVMISFVDVCAKCINIKYGRKLYKLKKILKRVLCSNKDLESELKGFNDLVQGLNNIQGTLSFELAVDSNTRITSTGLKVDDIETGVTVLTEAQKQQKSEGARREDISRLKNALGVTEADSGTHVVYEDMWRKMARDTGNWFQKVDAYTRWADKSQESTGSLLLLMGAPSTGKSFSVSAMVHDLKSRKAATDSVDRSLVGYYFFPSTIGKSGDEKKRPEIALKRIALQLAEQDRVYAKKLVDFCSNRTDEKNLQDANCQKLWADLRLGSPGERVTHFIILDGIENLPATGRARLAEIFRTLPAPVPAVNCHIRVLVSGSSDTFDRGLLRIAGDNAIDIGDYCREEMQTYIAHELEGAGIFQDQDQKSRTLVQKIQTQLVDQPECSFYKIQTALRKIEELVGSGGTEAELEQLLDELNADPGAILEAEVRKVQASLTPRQIDELNELLIWVHYGERYFNAIKLKAALVRQHHPLASFQFHAH
jgi:Cdc6-like AAA superfamily ATPase